MPTSLVDVLLSYSMEEHVFWELDKPAFDCHQTNYLKQQKSMSHIDSFDEDNIVARIFLFDSKTHPLDSEGRSLLRKVFTG